MWLLWLKFSACMALSTLIGLPAQGREEDPALTPVHEAGEGPFIALSTAPMQTASLQAGSLQAAQLRRLPGGPKLEIRAFPPAPRLDARPFDARPFDARPFDARPGKPVSGQVAHAQRLARQTPVLETGTWMQVSAMAWRRKVSSGFEKHQISVDRADPWSVTLNRQVIDRVMREGSFRSDRVEERLVYGLGGLLELYAERTRHAAGIPEQVTTRRVIAIEQTDGKLFPMMRNRALTVDTRIEESGAGGLVTQRRVRHEFTVRRVTDALVYAADIADRLVANTIYGRVYHVERRTSEQQQDGSWATPNTQTLIYSDHFGFVMPCCTDWEQRISFDRLDMS